MANHRAAGRAQVRPLTVATGSHRDKTLPAGVVKVGVLGALATATIAVPLASATAGGMPIVDASVGSAPAPAPAAAPAPAKPAAPVQLPSVAGEARTEAAASRADERGSRDEAASRSEDRKADEGAAKGKKADEQAEGTGITVEVPEPEIVDESGVSLGTSGSGYTRPVSGRITSGYGYRIHPVLGYSKMHEGVDFGAGCGTPVHAVQAGTVVAVEYHGASGKRVKVDHGNGVTTGYYHLQGYATSVGATVEQGQVVGYVGSTGRSTGCHLHFAAIDGSGNYFNPMNILK